MHSPQSRDGRWAVALAGLSLGGIAAVAIAFSLGMESASGFSDNWLLTAVGAAILVCAAASVVSGGMAMRRRDRAWTVLAATGLGVLVTALMLQQLAEGSGWLGA